jgi:hypothetical protein
MATGMVKVAVDRGGRDGDVRLIVRRINVSRAQLLATGLTLGMFGAHRAYCLAMLFFFAYSPLSIVGYPSHQASASMAFSAYPCTIIFYAYSWCRRFEYHIIHRYITTTMTS